MTGLAILSLLCHKHGETAVRTHMHPWAGIRQLYLIIREFDPRGTIELGTMVYREKVCEVAREGTQCLAPLKKKRRLM